MAAWESSPSRPPPEFKEEVLIHTHAVRVMLFILLPIFPSSNFHLSLNSFQFSFVSILCFNSPLLLCLPTLNTFFYRRLKAKRNNYKSYISLVLAHFLGKPQELSHLQWQALTPPLHAALWHTGSHHPLIEFQPCWSTLPMYNILPIHSHPLQGSCEKYLLSTSSTLRWCSTFIGRLSIIT